MKIIPGATFETPVAKYTVTSTDGGRVTYDQTAPDGTVLKNRKRPLDGFQKMVAAELDRRISAATAQPTGNETEIAPGKSFQTEVGRYDVTAKDGGKVTYDKTAPDGTVMKNQKRPLAIFQKMVANATLVVAKGSIFETPRGRYTVSGVNRKGMVDFQVDTRGRKMKGTLPIARFQDLIATSTPPTKEVIQRTSALPEAAELPTESRPHARLGTRTEDVTEETAEFRRLDALYRGLSESDRYYIVERWDHEQGRDLPYKRLQYKREARSRQRSGRCGRSWHLSPQRFFGGGLAI